MTKIQLKVNTRMYSLDVDPDMPLLWVIRDFVGLAGTKYGCGIGQCGACTVHVDGKAIRSCMVKSSAMVGKEITTIEGLSVDARHPLQRAWIDEDVPQCGYCQAGQIMNAATLLSRNPNPSEEEIANHMNGNLCRCGTYHRIHSAIKKAASYDQSAN